MHSTPESTNNECPPGGGHSSGLPLALVAVGLKTFPVLVLTHLLTALFDQRTHAGETSLLEMWLVPCGT